MELTRRELLTAFLGAPLAAAACRPSAYALPQGELVGTAHETGHRLRGRDAAPVPSRWESHDVVIVGTGIAGLSAAWRIGDRRETVLLELEPAIGGTSRSAASFPWGAHYVIAPSRENHAMHRLLEEMHVARDGVIGEEFLCRDPEERLFYRGRWYEGLYLQAGASSDDLRQLREFDAEIAKWAAWRDAKGRRAFAIPIAHCSDDAEVVALDRMSMKEWLDTRGFTSPRLRWFVEYGCRDDYGTLLADTSAWAGIFYFASRDDRPVVTWPEGNGRIVSHLARGRRVLQGWMVTSVVPTASGADVIAVRGGEALGLRANAVIFAGPQFVARFVVESSRERSNRFTYGSWMVANLTLRGRPASAGFPLSWDNVFYDSPSLGYVVATHQKGLDHGPTVLTYYLPLCDADPHRAREALLAGGREAWAEVALADIERAHPEIRQLTERVDVMRWGHAMVRPTPGFVWSQDRRRAADPIGAIHFANTDLSGVALFEEALHHGVRAAEEVLGSSETWL